MDINKIDSFTSFDSGEEIEYTVLLNFECEELNKHYIVYTDYSEDEEGNTNLKVSSYNPELDELVLEKVEDPVECQLVDQVLAETFKD